LTPERSMSSDVRTATAAAASEIFSGYFETDVTSISASSSTLNFFNVDGETYASCATLLAAKIDRKIAGKAMRHVLRIQKSALRIERPSQRRVATLCAAREIT